MHKSGTEIPEVDPGLGEHHGFLSGVIGIRLRPPHDGRVQHATSEQVDSF